MKKLINILPVLILTAMLLSAFTSAHNSVGSGPLNGSNLSIQAQDTAEPTTPPIVETVLVPVTGDDNTANNNANLLVYVLIGIAGLAFFVALVALLARSNQGTTHTH